MITEGIIITSIICATILCICFLIGYYTNKETKEQRLKDIRSIITHFKDTYIIYDKEKAKFIGNSDDVVNIIRTIRDITY